MARIILIETSTALCSVALEEDGRVVAYKENPGRVHASLTAPFVKEVLDSQGLGVKDCDAVCVGKGPGSYTGLRVGASTAKGLCFGADIPLLAVSSTEVLVWQARTESLIPDGCKYIVPMIDARRMEVYTAVYSSDGQQLRSTESKIIDKDSFAQELSEGPVLFIGDGAEKCRSIFNSPKAYFISCYPKASSLTLPAELAFKEKRFEDTAYFEPFYLKDFIATVSRKRLF